MDIRATGVHVCTGLHDMSPKRCVLFGDGPNRIMFASVRLLKIMARSISAIRVQRRKKKSYPAALKSPHRRPPASFSLSPHRARSCEHDSVNADIVGTTCVHLNRQRISGKARDLNIGRTVRSPARAAWPLARV